MQLFLLTIYYYSIVLVYFIILLVNRFMGYLFILVITLWIKQLWNIFVQVVVFTYIFISLKYFLNNWKMNFYLYKKLPSRSSNQRKLLPSDQ